MIHGFPEEDLHCVFKQLFPNLWLLQVQYDLQSEERHIAFAQTCSPKLTEGEGGPDL